MKNIQIHNMVKASGVTSGELVLVHFWGEDTDKAIANEFVAAVASLGATPILLQQARSVNRAIFQNATENCFGEAYFAMFSKFDAVLDVFAYQPIILGDSLEPTQMKLYRRYISRLFSALTQAKRFTQIRMPTEANAQESGLEPGDYITRMEQAYNIDYDALQAGCLGKKAQLEAMSQLVVHSGANCALSLDLTGRVWHIDAGDGDWPCGEIYIAPNEAKTQGSVFFETLFLEDVGLFSDVTLYIQDGMLTRSSHGEINAFLQSLSPENRVVCELGFGMNPNVTNLCGYTVLDEKMAGTFHIAIGANHLFGGENKADIHLDLVNAGPFRITPP